MSFFISITLLLMFGTGHVMASDLCEEPAKTICSAPKSSAPVTEETIRDEASKVLGAKGLKTIYSKHGVSRSAVKEYKEYVKTVYTLLLDHFEKNGIPRSAIQAKIESIKERVATDLIAGKMGSSAHSSGPKSNQALAKRTKSAKVSFFPTNEAEAESFFEDCGVDGLTFQAYYADDRNVMTLCPGYLLNVLNSGGLDSMEIVVAHELTHGVDAGPGEPQFARYEKFGSCIQNNYANNFEKIDHVIEELGDPAQARLEKKMNELKAAPGDHALEIVQVELMMKNAKGQVKDLKATRQYLSKKLRRSPQEAETHSWELISDLGGTESLVEHLRTLPKEKRAMALSQSARMFCGDNADAIKLIKYGPLKDDSSHPPREFRINLLMNNPEVRLLMGCKKLEAPGPWCAASESNVMTARCTRETGIELASQCEDALYKRLRSAGCQPRDLSCDPGNGTEVACSIHSSNCKPASRAPGSSDSGTLSCGVATPAEELKVLGIPLPAVCILPEKGEPKFKRPQETDSGNTS